MVVSEIASQMRDRIPASAIRAEDYVSTENMRPNFGGIERASSSPPSGTLTAYQEGDILLSNIRPYFRKTWLATHSGGCNADILCIRANPTKCLPKYLYYLFTTDTFVNDYLKSCKGAKMPRGDVQRLLDYEFDLPDLSTQLRIAGVLGSLDEKIALNRKKIAELEVLAKTIYDYWFVQFDFPDKDGKPYKSSGGKMVWNEQLKREVPEGWEVVPLVDMAAITMGQSPRGDSLNESGEGTLFFQGSSDFGDISPSNRVYTTAPTRMAKSGDILLSVRAPVGTSNIALHPCCIGRGLASLRGKECTNTFIHQALALIKSRFESKNVDGTTFGSLSKDELCNMPILKPASFIIQIFDSFVKPIETNIINLVHQIRELIILRDTLLPLLMNGQAEVG